MDNDELLENLKTCLHKRDNEELLIEFFKDHHPYDLAKAFEELNDQERQEIYDTIPEDLLAELFSYLDEEVAASLIKEMSYEQGADVLNEMDADDAADILLEISEEDEEATYEYLEQMDAPTANLIKELSEYDEETAGAIMSTNFISIKKDMDVKDATKILGYEANDAEVIDPLFVVEDGVLVGIVRLQDLIIARTPKTVEEIMETSFIYGEVNENTIDIVNKINNYDIYALPILDNGILKGIVTMDDALDVASLAIEEDMSMLGAVSKSAIDEENVFKSIIKRLPWLVGLLVLSLLIGNITGIFEELISKITVLWFFNTMILDMAGNCGTQTLAVAVRRIGRKELETGKSVVLYLLKELLVVFINSILLGLLSFAICFAFIKILKYDQTVNIYVTSAVISVSLAFTLLLTGILGGIVPILMNKLHVDPAVASGPLITTLNDVLAMVIYFGLATLFMDKILL